MAVTSVQTNNKLIKFREQIIYEYVRENLFSPYMGTALTAIIRVINDLKSGGEQINVPLIARANAPGVGSGSLVGNEEEIDNYGFRAWIDWARNAMRIKKSEQHKSSIDLWGAAKPLLSDWGKEKQRDEICDALFALPSESAPAGLNSNAGQRVNGLLFDAATAAQRNTWITDNADRVLIGTDNTSNLVAGNFASSMANIATSEIISYALIMRMKRSAKRANPRIRPFRLKTGAEWFVLFVDQENFRNAGNDTTIQSFNKDARAREGKGMMDNPIFVDGDLLVNGIILREIPELSVRLPTFYLTAGGSSGRISPAFLCGQSAMAFCWGQMPKPTFLQENDYGFIRGSGIEMAYGIAKIAKKNPAGNLKEWGVFTGYFAAAADS